MPAKRRTVATALALLVALLAGCGGATEADRVLDARPSPTPLSAEDELVERRLVLSSDVAKAPPRSAERAFLQFWSAISFEDWATAVHHIDTSVRRTLDPGYLVHALRLEGQNNVPVKPLIRSIRQTRGGTSIRYYVRTAEARLRPTSSTWRRRDGVWYLAYSSTLDDSYGGAVQLGVQNELDPDAREAAKRAISAGRRAMRQQARALRTQP